jgi:hypothetical protein
MWVKRGVAVLAVSGLAMGAWLPSALAAPKVVKKKALASGVTYRQINDTAIPIRMYVLTFSPKTPATLDVVLSGAQIGTFARTSTMATNTGALAAVNGDLNDWPGRPTHQYVMDGMPVQTGSRAGTSVGLRRNEHGATIGHLPMRITATNVAAKSTVKVASWNTNAPTTNQVVGYSWYGGRYAKPSSSQCTARLGVPAAMRWEPKHDGTGRDYTVEAVSCSAPLSVSSSSKVVLASKLVGDGATWIKSLKAGTTVHVGWSNGSVGAEDVVSGSALILKGGVVQYSANCSRDLCQRNCRTAVGVTASGQIIMMVVDGRSSGSVGLTLYQLGKEMQALGAVDAANLDGGGSATMWIKGLGVVNHPTDSSGERPVSNAIVILPGSDLGEPKPLKPLA